MADQSTGPWRTAATAGDFRAAIAAFFPPDASAATIETVPGGFSGSPVARVVLPCGVHWALKALPPAMDAVRASRLHRLMGHLRSRSLEWVPAVAELPGGGSVWQDDSGRNWEMLSWMPGWPRLQPTATERATAVAAVAALHVRAAGYPEQPAILAAAPSLRERIVRCRQLDPLSWRERLEQAAGGLAEAATSDRFSVARIVSGLAAASDVLARLGGPALSRAGFGEPQPERLIMVVRDLTADHLLFAEPGDASDDGLPRITGLIDFHATRLDTPACDLGRLLASWHDGLPPPEAVREAVACYCGGLAGHGLEPPDAQRLRRSVAWITATAVVLGLDNWLRWLVEERRQFTDWSAVAGRIERSGAALPAALQRLVELPARGLVG